MIRPAIPEDVPEIHALTCELADYEKLRHKLISTPADFRRALFGERPLMEALVAEIPEPTTPESPSQLAGSGLFYPTFSTFTGQPGLWLEDLYVRPQFRGQGIGRALLDHLLNLARERGCARAEWSVLDWNEPAIRFYQELGAEVMPDWRIARVEL